MLKLPDGTVWLNEGETIPVFCECGFMYQPETTYQPSSVCPVCKRENVHRPTVTRVPFKAGD